MSFPPPRTTPIPAAPAPIATTPAPAPNPSTASPDMGGSWSVPPFHVEWLIAAMMGLGVALGAAGAVAFVEIHRFDPPPPTEAGAHEWATPRPKPIKSAPLAAGSQEVGSETDTAADDAWEQPVVDVEIGGSASVSASASVSE